MWFINVISSLWFKEQLAASEKRKEYDRCHRSCPGNRDFSSVIDSLQSPARHYKWVRGIQELLILTNLLTAAELGECRWKTVYSANELHLPETNRFSSFCMLNTRTDTFLQYFIYFILCLASKHFIKIFSIRSLTLKIKHAISDTVPSSHIYVKDHCYDWHMPRYIITHKISSR